MTAPGEAARATSARSLSPASEPVRRVLIVTYQWFPMFNVGVKHVSTLARYLPDAGWEAHILTKDWREGLADGDAFYGLRAAPPELSPALAHASTLPVTRTRHRPRKNAAATARARLAGVAGARWSARGMLRRALEAAYPLYGEFPDPQRGWAEGAVAEGVRAAREHDCDAVLSVCPPASAHILGGEIARRAELPWVVLFADLFSFYQGDGDGRSPRLRWEMRTLARRWLRGATRAAAISPRMVEYVTQTYGIPGEVVVVPFDPAEGAEEGSADSADGARRPLQVRSVGSLYPEDQRPEILLDALDLLAAREPRLEERMRVQLVGTRAAGWLASALRGRPAERVVDVIEAVPPAEAVRLQRSAHLLLTFNYQNPIARSAGGTLSYPCKMFEYWNAARPMIAVGGDPGGFVDALLRETGAGETAPDAPALAAMLGRALAGFEASGRVPFVGDRDVIARYGAPAQARTLAHVLDEAVAAHHGRRGSPAHRERT